MLSPERWAQLIGEVVTAIPSALGETVDAKKQRVANYAGISRATLFNILAGNPTKLFPVHGWIRILQMIPEGKVEIRREHVEKILQVAGLNLEKTGSS